MNVPSETAATFHRIVEERRTIRVFRPDPVPQDALDRCLDSALRAPSASNLQPWEFVIINNPEIRKQANAICLDQRGPQTAPMLIALVTHCETERRNSRYILDTLKARGILRKSQEKYWGRMMPLVYAHGPLGILGLIKKAASRVISLFRPMPNMFSHADLRVMTQKSTALAAATFMLALKAEGFDSCPMEGFDPWRARKLLKLPRGADVCMFIAIGKRAETGLWWERILVPREWTVREI